MTIKLWVRHAHRWVSIAFTIISVAIFLALGLGREPVQWVYFLPLFPLALLVLSGLYLFCLPYTAQVRANRSARCSEARRP